MCTRQASSLCMGITLGKEDMKGKRERRRKERQYGETKGESEVLWGWGKREIRCIFDFVIERE